MQPPKSVQVKLNLKVLAVTGIWEPNDAERAAAWELYVELITRAAVVPLENGLLREALSSLYSLFSSARSVLREYGPQVAEPRRDGEYNLGYLLVVMLNYAVRPVLSYWHPALQAWEHTRPTDTSPIEHERAWDYYDDLRAVLADCRDHLAIYAGLLATACGVPDLQAAIPTPPSDY